jgi:DNA primase large subunit
MPPNPLREQMKAQVEADLLEEIMPRINEIMDVTEGNEGVLALKQQELMIRSQENEDDKRIAEEKLALEREKMNVREETDEEKMRSQEDIAALRAQISREKMEQAKKK